MMEVQNSGVPDDLEENTEVKCFRVFTGERNHQFVRFEEWRSNEDKDEDEYERIVRNDSSPERNMVFGNHSVWKACSKGLISSIKEALSHCGAYLADKLLLWRNEILLVLSVTSLSLDPLFCYLLIVNDEKQCLRLDSTMGTLAIVLRSVIDLLYTFDIFFQLRATVVTLSHRTYGEAELVPETRITAWRSLLLYFLVDIFIILPLPQVLVSAVIPKLNDSGVLNAIKSLNIMFIIQYVLRVLRICSLLKVVLRTSGILAKSPWANLFFLMLASHVLGAFWYLFSIERKAACWLEACNHLGVQCSLYCGKTLRASTFLSDSCSSKTPNSTLFDFGIYLDALASGVVDSADIVQKISYCFWWGLQNLSSLGQSLKTSTYIWEIYFSVFVSICGLLSFAFLIGNVQAYLLSEVARSEEMRAKTEEMRSKRQEILAWMASRSFPENLKERILQTIECKFKENILIDMYNLLHLLPMDLRKDATRQLGSDLLRSVPYFHKWDLQVLDVMCDSLEPVIYTEESYIIREKEPVDVMVFIVHGRLLSVTMNGEKTGSFFNSPYLKVGDVCGEELLLWALDVHSSSDHLPISTRTIQPLSKVLGLVLNANDLKLIGSQFRQLQLHHRTRFYSQGWRTWAAYTIQAAWHRYWMLKRKEALAEKENERLQNALKAGPSTPSLGATIYASHFAANVLRPIRSNVTHRARVAERRRLMRFQKPSW